MERSLETALVIVLEDAEPFERVRRELHAEAVAKGVPFHITLLYPFVPRDELTDESRAELRSFFAGRPPLAFELTRIEAFPRVVYATPEPAAALLGCMHALYTRFPGYPPYGGAFPDPVPHATLGENVDEGQAVEDVARSLAPHLPMPFRGDAATLIEEFEADRWRLAERFPLGG